MKTLPAVAGSLVGLLAVLSLPGPEPPVAPAPARGHGFAWNQDAFWHSLEKTYGDARAVGCRAADPVAARELSALGSTADRLLGAPLDPGAAVLDSVERRFFTLAPLFAACPRHLGDYVRLSGRLREAIKWQSRRWDVAADAARARLYRSLYGLRGAVEEVMLHHPDGVVALLDGRHEPSATPATTVQGVEIHSGDILVSRGGYPTSALIARGNDYPGNFSHIALVHVDSVSHVASAIEAHIERGVAVSTADEYLGDKKLRIMVLRLRADLPQLGPQPQHHDPQLLVAQVLVRGGHGDTALDVGFDRRRDVRHAVHVHQRDVREIAGVIVAAGDERRRRVAAARDQDVSRVDLHAVHRRRGRRRGLVTAVEQRGDAVGVVQHHLFYGAAQPVEGAVQPRARRIARDVPATRLPLDRLPQAAGKSDVVPEMARARRDERRQRKEPAFDRVQHRRTRIERRAEQPVGGGAQGRKLAGGHGVCRAAADGAGVPVGLFERAP